MGIRSSASFRIYLMFVGIFARTSENYHVKKRFIESIIHEVSLKTMEEHESHCKLQSAILKNCFLAIGVCMTLEDSRRYLLQIN